jgi:HK97 family phage major capsid protein
MHIDINAKIEQRGRLIMQAASILQAAEVSAEDRAKAEKIMADVAVLEGDIASLRNLAALEAETRSFVPSPRPTGNPSASAANVAELPVEEQKKLYSAAFRQYARHGVSSLNAEQRSLLTTSDATGGALIPQMFLGSLISAKKYFGSVPGRVRQKVTNNNGAPMKISYSNDTANGLVLLGTEGTSAPSETDPSFVSAILNVDTVSGGLIKVSFQELEDSAFDLDAFIRESFSIRYLRGLEAAVTLGKDTAGTTLPNQASGGLVGVATAGTTTGTIAAGIGWTDIVNVFGALDPAYLTDTTAWVFNTQVRTTLLGMKDGFGRPFWTPDPTGDGPFSKLLGYDVILDQQMANTGVANAIPILFGDLNQAYMLRTDGAPSILRLNERFADQLMVGFYLYTRIGGISLNAGVSPLVKLTIAAS